MRKLIYLAVLSLVTTITTFADYASARSERFIHVDSTEQFPQTKWKIVRHTIQLHIPQESSALSQLSIDVPSGLTVSDDISVSDSSNQKVNTNVSVKGSKVTLVFPQAITPGNLLDIDMNRVRISGVSNAWLYHVSAKLVGIDADILLGVARFRVY